MTASVAVGEGGRTGNVAVVASPAALSGARLVSLHLVPGALATLAFVLLAAPVGSAGYPPLAAFLVAIAVTIVPFELGVVALAGRGAPGGSRSLLSAIPYQRPMRSRDWIVLVPGLLVIAVVAFGLAALLEAPIRNALFGWLPAWFVAPVPLESIADYSAGSWAVTLVGFLALNGVIGPVTEELYFRGYLLPRMSQYGRWAPLLNVTLFSLYHFWSPWQLLSRIAAVTPFAYVSRWKQNVYLAVAVHVLLNTVSVATVAAIVLGRLG